MSLTELFGTGILAIISLSGFLFTRREYHLPVIVFILLVVVGDINQSLRIVLNISAILYLGIVFLAKYDFFINNYPHPPRELSFFFGLYIGSIIISTVFSYNIPHSLEQVLRILLFFCIVYLLYTQIKDINSLKYLFITIVLASSAASLIIIFNFIINPEGLFNLEKNVVNRTSGIYGNVNALGGLFTVSWMIFLSSYLLGYLKHFRFLSFLFLIINISGIFLNSSRSAMFGIVIGTITILFITKRKYLLYIFLSLFLLLLVVVSNTELFNLVSVYFRFEDSISGRDHYWDMSVKMFKDNWFIGIGPAAFNDLTYKYLSVMVGSWSETLINHYSVIAGHGLQHNVYLFILSELGVIGFVIFLYLIFIYSKKVILLFKETEIWLRFVGLIGAGTGIGFLARGFFESLGILTYGWLSVDLPFWIITLSLFSAQRLVKQKNS